jgi:hypothetical protein
MPMSQKKNDVKPNPKLSRETWLIVLAIANFSIYVGICWLSRYFEYGSDKMLRPIPLVLSLFAAAFVVYLIATQIATKIEMGITLLALIFIPAILFRGVMMWSEPIQEVDIYRYLWDGAVQANGVSPFKYPPGQVRRAIGKPDLPDDLSQLVTMARSRPGLKQSLDRIHFGDVPTVYPPTSQLGFALVDRLTPNSADLRTRVNSMRSFLILCELATSALVVLLLLEVGKSAGFAILHAWCPLLIKETANSGHLDSMAVLLATMAIYFGIRMARPRVDAAAKQSGFGKLFWGVAAAIALAFAIGAKLYPIAFALWFLALSLQSLGWKKTLVPGVVLLVSTFLIMLPIIPPEYLGSEKEEVTIQPDEGFKTFLSRWEMNDFLFLIAIENVRIREDIHEDYRPWFSVVPDGWQRQLNEWVITKFDIEPKRVPFAVSRLLTGVVFCGLAAWFAWKAGRIDDHSDSRERYLEMAFLTVAWFFLLCPTQNPWYWSWVLPLLPFARSRVWWLMSGALFAYYLRFWLTYHFKDTAVGGTTYPGATYFDLVVTWFEFAPWFALLALDACTGFVSRLLGRAKPS